MYELVFIYIFTIMFLEEASPDAVGSVPESKVSGSIPVFDDFGAT